MTVCSNVSILAAPVAGAAPIRVGHGCDVTNESVLCAGTTVGAGAVSFWTAALHKEKSCHSPKGVAWTWTGAIMITKINEELRK